MKIAFFSAKQYDKQYFDKFNNGNTITYYEASLNDDTVNLTEGFDVICVFVNDKIDAAVIKQLAINGVKLIALRCAGYNNVDLNVAKAEGIQIVRVPAYSPHAVAEHAVALLLTLNRKTHKAYNRIREGNFSLERLVGFDLNGKTVAVIGTGNIGIAFCKIMLGFGCRVLAFDVVANKLLEQKGVEYLPLVDLLPQADVISLHCPLNEQTRQMINAHTIAMMKDGVTLINTSRGALVDTKAVIKALKNGKIAHLGLDVYEQESSLFFNDLSENIIQDDVITRLLSFPNVLVTAHQGFFTEEALTQIAQITLNNIKEFEEDIHLTNGVK